MQFLFSLLLFVLGLGLIIYCAEQLVKGAIGTSLRFGMSTFLVSVIFISFDPENLFLGAVASYEQAAGLALGSIIGATMVAIALAFGITILFAPMEFEKAPKKTIVVPVFAVLLLGVLSLDGQLSRIDGAMLLVAFAVFIYLLLRLSKKGLDIEPKGEVAESLDKTKNLSKWKSFWILLASLVGIIVGSELLVTASRDIVAHLGLSETVFGMTILALLVSIEELARELPAALKGRPEISYGNVSGSILAFFLFNAGIIALVRPVPVSEKTLYYYYPICLLTVILVSIFMLFKKVPRWAGAVFVALYLIFSLYGYVR